MLSWFDSSEAEEFGNSLADLFIKRVPLDNAGRKAASTAKRQEVMEKMFLQVIQFRAKKKLNVYKKAKFGNTFKWRMREAGYDPAAVDELTHALMIRF